MLNFNQLSLNDRDFIKKYTQSMQIMQSNYSFEFNYNYRDTMIAESDNHLYIKSFYKGSQQFFMPIGHGDSKIAIYKLIEYLDTLTEDFHIHKLTLSQRNLLESLYPGKFTFDLARDEQEYIYITNSLCNFNGNALRAKRNQVNNITKNMSWSFDPITQENIQECFFLTEKWNQNKSVNEISLSAEIDNQALLNALNDFFILNLDGGILTVEQKTMAFMIGCPLSSDVFMCLFIRADRSIRGIYQLLFREFVRKFAANYHFFNNLEDVGDPGLRQCKLSYQPFILEEVYTASLKI